MRTLFKTLFQAQTYLCEQGFTFSNSIWFKNGLSVAILAPTENRPYDTYWQLARVVNLEMMSEGNSSDDK